MWLSDFTLVLPDRLLERGSLRLEAGRIAEIADTPTPGGVPGDGLHLMPGAVDMHGDMIEQEIEPRSGVDMPMEIALNSLDGRLAEAGVTTAYASVSFSRTARASERRHADHTARVIESLHAAREGLRIDHRIHARFDVVYVEAIAQLRALVEGGKVDLVSLMDHTPGQGQYRDAEKFVSYLKTDIGLEDGEARAWMAEKMAGREAAEPAVVATLREVAALCRAHGLPMASHDDDTEEKAALMAELGCAIAEFPVSEEAARAARAHGMAIAMGAPNALRGKSYSGNLSARRTHEMGLLGMLAADYHPASILPAMKILAETDPDGLPGAARLLAEAPAAALGLSDRGRLAPGLRADLAAADLSGPGRAVATWCAGRPVHSDGTLAGL